MNIVFDFGAVLFTWQPAELVRQYFPALKNEPEQAQRLAEDIFRHEDWQHFDCGMLDMATVISRTASRLALDHPTLESLITRIGDHLLPIACNVRLLGRLAELRDAGADLQLYYLSNMPAPYARVLEQRHAFLRGFAGGVFSADVKLGKPDPAIFELLAARYDLAAGDTLFIDDMLANVQAAQTLGWRTIHCVPPEGLQAQLGQLIPLG